MNEIAKIYRQGMRLNFFVVILLAYYFKTRSYDSCQWGSQNDISLSCIFDVLLSIAILMLYA